MKPPIFVFLDVCLPGIARLGVSGIQDARSGATARPVRHACQLHTIGHTRRAPFVSAIVVSEPGVTTCDHHVPSLAPSPRPRTSASSAVLLLARTTCTSGGSTWGRETADGFDIAQACAVAARARHGDFPSREHPQAHTSVARKAHGSPLGLVRIACPSQFDHTISARYARQNWGSDLGRRGLLRPALVGRHMAC